MTASDNSKDGGVDLALMRTALGLARRGLGAVWPNPAVGCVIANEGRIVGRGWTQPGGRPHAEAEALARAGAAAAGATAYVTLEPCCHFPGRTTPPCAEALIAAKIARVVAAIDDPNPNIAGRGVARLRAAGVAVETGLCAAEAAELNAGFFARIKSGRPLVTLKLATSLDGRIATAAGESRWITGASARERAHLLRAQHDAILVGTETVIADDPELTCRLPGLAGCSPVRIVLDRRGRIPATARIFDTAAAPTWLVTAAGAGASGRAAQPGGGIERIEAEVDPAGGFDLAALLSTLGRRGLTRVLVEGGGRLAASLLRRKLVDRVVWFHAPAVIGGDGLPAVAPLGFASLAEAPRFERLAGDAAGDDVMTILRANDAG